jgi:dTDP-4-amino-4,6-dideoxygalactose transaminase
MTKNAQYQSALASFLGIEPSRLFLYWKGRVALYSVLKAMRIGPGDEVILPAFTCVVVPNAILYLGAKPVYVDINSSTLCAHTPQIEAAITSRTKAILIQNMLGLSVHVEDIVTLAKAKGIYTIEDCTHGFGGSSEGVYYGLHSDAAFFSSQWNKPFSTGIGGMLVVNNEKLIHEVGSANELLIPPSFKERFILSLLLFSKAYLVKGSTYWRLLKLYRWLSKKGLVVGSSSNQEISGIEMPRHYFKAMSGVQSRAGLRALQTFTEVVQTRKERAHQVHQWLTIHNKIRIPNEFLEQHAFLKYPLLVQDRTNFIMWAEKENIPLGDWFVSPLHPVTESLLPWGLVAQDFPNALEISGSIVNLSLDIPATRLINFLELYKNEIK